MIHYSLFSSLMRKIFYHFSWLVFAYHWLWAFFSALVYGFPSKNIFVLGVTGTKGKSTVLELITFILEKSRKKVAVSSSVRNGESSMTMPGRFFLQKFLRRAIDDGCDYALVEVTSQGVLQNRHRFIKWDGVIFTNLSSEHIEAHGTFEKYREAKLDFFRYVRNQELGIRNNELGKLFLVNKDDKSAQYFINAADGSKIILYSKSELQSNLIGDFNKYNIGAAVAFAESQGIDYNIIKEAVREFSGVSGRMEFLKKEPFAVVVDYAHTPDSLKKVYETLRNSKFIIHNSKLICVLGAAGGGRDKWKRPEMGKIAAQYCNEIILTDEDSYEENPAQILSEIKSRINNFPNLYEILDRKEAIKKSIDLAKPGDVVIITGKGSERWIHLKDGRKIPWSDKQMVLSNI